MSAIRSAIERAGSYGKAALNALVLDDWKALTEAHSTMLQRVGGAADLGSWMLPEAKVAELAGHAIVKASQIAAEHLASAGLQHTAEHVAGASAIGARWAARSENAKVAGQHFANPSTIWDRPLTPAERTGAFQNKHDLAALWGPSTKRGGAARDLHHIVESQTESRFGPERVHNIENVGAIERNPIHRDISKAYQRNNPSLGPGPDGKDQSLRDYLKDKSWEFNKARGEKELRLRHVDPDVLRAESREHFKARLQLHDRIFERSNERGATTLLVPGVEHSMNRSPVQPNIADVQAGVDRLRTSGTHLPDVQSVEAWNGKAGFGTFVDLGDGVVAQHNGRGQYSFMDVQRDLGGVQPPIGQYVELAPNGHVELSHQGHALVHGR